MEDLAALCRLDAKVRLEFERLLKEALPSRLRLHQLVKTFQQEAPEFSYYEIESRLLELYQLPYDMRTGAVVRRKFEVRPYPWLVGQLLLNFSNAVVTETTKYKTATTLQHAITESLELPPPITSVAVLHEVVHRLVKPRSDQKKTGIRFDDFIERWRQVCFRKYGDLYDSIFTDLDHVAHEASSWSARIPMASPLLVEQELNPLEISQTDLDWMKVILEALEYGETPPEHPLSRGPQNPTLVRVETLVRTLRLVPDTKQAAIKSTVTRTCTTILKAYGQVA